MKAAFRARKAYLMSFKWLNVEALDLAGADHAKVVKTVDSAFRQCALKYHPDRLPAGATAKHRENAEYKLAVRKLVLSILTMFRGGSGWKPVWMVLQCTLPE